MDEDDFQARGPLSWIGGLLTQGPSEEDGKEEEQASKDGPGWINSLSDQHKRFLIQKVSRSD